MTMPVASSMPSTSSTPSTSPDTSLGRATSTNQHNTTNPSVVFKAPIKWTDEMILVLCREVEFINPFQYKERTKKSGKAWEDIASNLRKHGYDVEKRAVRDKYNKIKDGIQKKNAKELRESGIAPELTNDELEITQIVEDMQEVEKETKEQQGEVRAEEEKKQHDGVEMRQRALETFTETNKRIKTEEDSQEPRKKKRNSGGDCSKYLVQKMEMERGLREREFELRKEELERKREDENRKLEKEEREEERMRQQEERKQEREDREEERRRRDDERRREKEERDEDRRRREETERERRFELLQQQLLQQNQMLMMLMKKEH